MIQPAYERDIETISHHLHRIQLGHPSMLYVELNVVKNGTFALVKNKYGGSEAHHFIRELDAASAAMALAARGHKVKIVNIP